MRIKEEFKKSGYFWLPSAPDKKHPGTLSISDGGNIELEITTGQLKDRNGTFNINMERIVGYLHGSIPSILVTLDDCRYKILPTLGGISKSLILIRRVFIGVQYDEGEIPSFNTLTFSVEGIDDWVETSGVKVEYTSENCPIISYEPQEDITLNLHSDMQLLITWKSSLKHLINKQAGISENIYFKLVSQSARELDEFISVVRKITEFLCFVMNETVPLDSMHATSDKLTRETEDDKTVPVPIGIYYPSWPYSKDEPQIAWYDILFKFERIQNDVEKIICNWIDAYERIAPAFNLYFLAQMEAQPSLEATFLTLVTGLEVYHRRTSDEKEMDEVEFEKLVENLIENCLEEKRGWLEGKLMFANELVLRKRIKKLIEPFKSLFGNKKKRKKLINWIVDTRNYLTHYNPRLELKAAKGQALQILCQKMETLFQLHFLQLIGFSQEEINSIVANCTQLKRKCDL